MLGLGCKNNYYLSLNLSDDFITEHMKYYRHKFSASIRKKIEKAAEKVSENKLVDNYFSFYIEEMRQVALNMKIIELTINSETKKYSVLDLISEFYKGNLALQDKAITDNIPAWLLNKFDDYLSISDNPQDESYNFFKKLKDIMEDILGYFNIDLSSITERIIKVNIKESVFKDTDFYAFKLIDDLINYVAYRADFKGVVKYYISSHDNANAYTRMQRYNGEAPKGLIPIFINLYSMDDEFSIIVEYVKGKVDIKKDVFKSALANIINTITHEIVHTKEVYSKWISHEQDFYKKQIVSLGDFDASKDWGNIESFIKTLQDKYADKIRTGYSYKQFIYALLFFLKLFLV